MSEETALREQAIRETQEDGTCLEVYRTWLALKMRIDNPNLELAFGTGFAEGIIYARKKANAEESQRTNPHDTISEESRACYG